MEDVKNKAESAEERFVRLAEPRVSRACKAISLIGNLAASGYACTEKQVDAMFGAMQQELDAAKARFDRSKKKNFRF